MNRFIFIIVFLLSLFSSKTSNAQDNILLLNGKSFEGKFLSKSEDLINFDFIKKSGKAKSFSLENSRIYSYTKSGEEESVLYKKDTSIYHFYSQYEMRMFIYGEKDAYERFKVTRPWVSSFAIGLGVSLFDTYLNNSYTTPEGLKIDKGFLNRQPSIAQFLIPFVVPVITGAIKPKMKAKFASDPTFLANENYIQGFKKVRRFKRVKSSLFGTLCGIATGMISYTIANSIDK